jgi:predicted dehydrogenase
MTKVNWGIIGCGDVTELKSGPAFNKVPNSQLVAVMRRDATKAADYALRHKVPVWYDDADNLINDTDVNAIYIATPPAFHETYTLAAIKAGKPVYVEKPMALDHAQAQRMYQAAEAHQVKLVVAHYRREWPLFKKIKELIDKRTIGIINLVRLVYDKPALTAAELAQEKMAWRINPAISGGGLFHDLAPHQLDILYHLFGDAGKIQGNVFNQSGLYQAPDLITGNILFKNKVGFNGSWYFNADIPADYCEIKGSMGNIRFSFFSSNTIELTIKGQQSTFEFDALQHVQQPMIEKTVNYFLGRANNPCFGSEAAITMQWMDIFVNGN